ncbi:MAG: hypothetical protein ACREQO_22895 [Candidatus Binatia bacterium]
MLSYASPSALKATRLMIASFSMCLSLLLLLSESWGQPVKLTVSYTGVGPVNLPVVLAKETGIFAKNGLDVTVVRAQAAVSTMALISGEVGLIHARPRRLCRATSAAQAPFMSPAATPASITG